MKARENSSTNGINFESDTGKCHSTKQIFFARMWLLRDSTDCYITDLLNSVACAFQQLINGLIRD